MDEQQLVTELIERIVRDARLPGRAAREHLREELQSHFTAIGSSPDAVRDGVRRFGNPEVLTRAFRYVYRWDYAVLYLLKIAASVIASMAVALVIQVVVNLRLEVQAEVWRLAPGFSKAAIISVGVVLGLATAWEGIRRPFDARRATAALLSYAVVWVSVAVWGGGSIGVFAPATLLVAVGYLCSRLGLRPTRLALTFAVFAGAIYGIHQTVHISVPPAQALLTSGVLLAVWASTVVILSQFDQAFGHLFSVSEKGSL
ncbi:MAG TPA: hypothetical protein VF219_08325 [Vicinamibacterales bacterium]